MRRVFLPIVVSALLVTLGFAQTPDAGSNTGQANVKGCLGGSDGNYTVAEDGTRQIFKITTSSVDLKPHLGHDVNLTGHKASGAVSSGAADNSFAVTEVNMISDHCAAAAAPPAATASPSSETASTPAAAPTTPTVTHRRGSLSLLISFVVLVIVLGTMAPLLGRWRKRKMLERTGTPNLSFTKEASSGRDKPELRKVA
jgi:hypothetical protein